MKPRSGLRSVIISLLFSLILSQFHKIPTTNPNSPSVPYHFGQSRISCFFLLPQNKIHFKKKLHCSMNGYFTVHGYCSLQSAAVVRNSFQARLESDSSFVWSVGCVIEFRSYWKNSRQLDNRYDLHKPVFGAGIVPAAENQRSRPWFQSDLSPARAIKILG